MDVLKMQQSMDENSWFVYSDNTKQYYMVATKRSPASIKAYLDCDLPLMHVYKKNPPKHHGFCEITNIEGYRCVDQFNWWVLRKIMD